MNDKSDPPVPAAKGQPYSYRCEECGGVFMTSDEWSDEQAHEEAVANFGQRGDMPGMAIVCDDCYRAIMEREGHA